MKRKLKFLILTVLVIFTVISLSGCDLIDTLFPSGEDSDGNLADIKVVSPENIDTEYFAIEEGTTYYTSPGFSLLMEVNGAFL